MNNIKIDNYKTSLVEVEAVLSCLNNEDYTKIPKDVIKMISINKNKNYIFEYDSNLDFKDWNLSLEAKAILYNLFKNYLATSEEKHYFIEKEKFENSIIEKEKLKKYNPDDIFKNNKKQENLNKEIEIIEYKKSIFRKIFNKIKNLFKH